MLRSNLQFVGGDPAEPNNIYYQAEILNNRTRDTDFTNVVPLDPFIRFNETRDTALVRDSSRYEFSIIRFTMNGANKDLPMFIPSIRVGQSDPNLTVYSLALTFKQTFNISTGPFTLELTPNPIFLQYEPEVKNAALAPSPRPPLLEQDLSSRYYWVLTYSHMVDLVNRTFLLAAQQLFVAFNQAWAAGPALIPGNPNPFPTFAAFSAHVAVPQITFDQTSQLFTILADTDAYGAPTADNGYTTQSVEPFIPVPYAPGVVGFATKPTARMFFNSNMFGLFSNFNSFYYNQTDIPGFATPVPGGYVNEILFTNNFYTNIVDYRLPPYGGVPPLGIVPIAAQKVYYQNTQDYKSCDTLWSPVSSIVFTTTLLPIRTENTGQPVIFGDGNLGDSTATSKSAFEPIITDIALDCEPNGASSYRQFIYYAPSAEYRMSDLSPSRQEIRSFDIQVFWKNRLDNKLYPVYMYNLSSVSIKCLFRKKLLA
jgi:hypothetical protein